MSGTGGTADVHAMRVCVRSKTRRPGKCGLGVGGRGNIGIYLLYRAICITEKPRLPCAHTREAHVCSSTIASHPVVSRRCRHSSAIRSPYTPTYLSPAIDCRVVVVDTSRGFTTGRVTGSTAGCVCATVRKIVRRIKELQHRNFTPHRRRLTRKHRQLDRVYEHHTPVPTTISSR